MEMIHACPTCHCTKEGVLVTTCNQCGLVCESDECYLRPKSFGMYGCTKCKSGERWWESSLARISGGLDFSDPNRS